MLVKMDKFFDKFANLFGYLCAIAMILMISNVFFDAIARYYFKFGSIGLQEMEWHLFSFIVLFGSIYTLKENDHVRVDVIYDKLGPKKKALINITGTLLFLLPISLLIAFGSIDFALEAYESGEMSGDPGGLKYRYLVKGMISLSFFLLIFYSFGFMIKNLRTYLGHKNLKNNHKEGL